MHAFCFLRHKRHILFVSLKANQRIVGGPKLPSAKKPAIHFFDGAPCTGETRETHKDPHLIAGLRGCYRGDVDDDLVDDTKYRNGDQLNELRFLRSTSYAPILVAFFGNLIRQAIVNFVSSRDDVTQADHLARFPIPLGISLALFIFIQIDESAHRRCGMDPATFAVVLLRSSSGAFGVLC